MSIICSEPKSISSPPALACLAPHTRVMVSDRGYVEACALAAGDLLIRPRADFAAITEVTAIRWSTSRRFVGINGSALVTESHPFLTVGGAWVCANELTTDDWLAGVDGPQPVRSVTPIVLSETPVLDVITNAPFVIEGFVSMSKSIFLQRRSMQADFALKPFAVKPLVGLSARGLCTTVRSLA
jgi:hypothetical protein